MDSVNILKEEIKKIDLKIDQLTDSLRMRQSEVQGIQSELQGLRERKRDILRDARKIDPNA